MLTAHTVANDGRRRTTGWANDGRGDRAEPPGMPRTLAARRIFRADLLKRELEPGARPIEAEAVGSIRLKGDPLRTRGIRAGPRCRQARPGDVLAKPKANAVGRDEQKRPTRPAVFDSTVRLLAALETVG